MRTRLGVSPGMFESQVKTRRRGGSISTYSPLIQKVEPRIWASPRHSPPTRRSVLQCFERNMPCCPHHCMSCSGSVSAWNIRSGGAAIRISPTTASPSGVSEVAGIALSSGPATCRPYLALAVQVEMLGLALAVLGERPLFVVVICIHESEDGVVHVSGLWTGEISGVHEGELQSLAIGRESS